MRDREREEVVIGLLGADEIGISKRPSRTSLFLCVDPYTNCALRNGCGVSFAFL